MRIAIVHDDLMRRGGAEQVVLSMLRAYPTADVYTMCYRRNLTFPEFGKYKIRTSLFNAISVNETVMKVLFFPLGLIAMKMLAVRGYDIVIISTTYCAKYVRIDKRSKVFIYTHTPFRIAWNPTSYQQYNESSGLKRILFDLTVRWLRKIDARSARKGHYFLGNTRETAERMKAAYGVNDVHIIHPPVKCDNFHQANGTGDYYLVVSRLEFYKRVDLAIEAFNQLQRKLIVVGRGSRYDELVRLAGPNIEFRSGLSKEEIAGLYAGCKAFIFPQHEDYGITPLEANASGRPVIAYGKGGVIETMKAYAGTSEPFTAVFFDEQTPAALIESVKIFETLRVDSQFISAHARLFDEEVFTQQLKSFVAEHTNV